MKKHPKMLEAIKNAKAAAYSTRGMYPVTLATNVYFSDGTTIESRDGMNESEQEETLDPDVEVDLNSDEEAPVAAAITAAEDGNVVGLNNGEISETLTIDKGLIFQGTNAGVAQNRAQDIE